MKVQMLMWFSNFNRISGFDPPPARVFAWRVLELKDQGVDEEEAMAVADVYSHSQCDIDWFQ